MTDSLNALTEHAALPPPHRPLTNPPYARVLHLTGACHEKLPISAVHQFCACPCPRGLMRIFMEGHVDLLPHKLQAIFNALTLFGGHFGNW